jgi:hypothetical protein
MLYREIIAVCSEIHTQHTSTLRARKIGFLGAIVELWKMTIRFVLSVRPSVRPHGTVMYDCAVRVMRLTFEL